MARSDRTSHSLSHASLTRHYEGFLRSLRQKRPETRGTYARALHEFLRWTGREKECALTTRDVERYKKHLTGGKKLSPVSVSTYLTALRRFCAYLVRVRVIAENPALAVGGNSRPRVHSRGTLTAADVESLLNCVDRNGERGLRDFAFLKLMVGCALSEIEIVRADVADMLVVNGTASLRVQGKGRVRKDQTVALPPDVRGAVEQYLAARGDADGRHPLFISAGNRTRGQRMTTRGVRDRVNMYLGIAGVKGGDGRPVTPYSLRHTAASLMALAGASAEEIRERLRLGSVATAMLYVHPGPKSPQGA